MDDEFYKKEFLNAYKTIKTKTFDLLGEQIEILSDYHANGSYETLNKHVKILDKPDYAYMIRSTDLEKLDFDNDVKYVDEHAYNHLKKTKLYGDEILINKIGSPGRTYLMPKLDRPATVGMNLFMIRLNKNSYYNSNFIWAYFNSNFGKLIINRKVNGTVPLTIDKEAVRSLYLPRLDADFQDLVAIAIDIAFDKLKSSKIIYQEAESILFNELESTDFVPSDESINIKLFSDSFGTSGRIDSEYYLPKYEQVVEHIKSTNHDTLDKIVTIKKSIEPGSSAYDETGLPFLRVADYNKFGLTEPNKKLSEKYCQENAQTIAKLKPKKDTILFSKDGSVGIAYHLTEDKDLVTSGAVLHLKIKDKQEVLPEYLTLVLNSQLVQMQAERDAGGSIILHWRVGEIENVVVPILDFDKQTEISGLVKESFVLKSQSEKLLHIAKRAVEIAIEKDEDTAEVYINKKCELLGVKLGE